MNTGEKIKQVRKAKGITQRQLAEKCGMKESAIGRIETKNPSLRTDTLTKIANALEVDPRELMPDRKIYVVGDHVFEGKLNGRSLSDVFIPDDIKEATSSRIKLEMIMDRVLNSKGITRLADYAEDLARIPEYIKNSPED